MRDVAQACAWLERKLRTCLVHNSAFPGPVQASARLVNKLVHYLYTSVHKGSAQLAHLVSKRCGRHAQLNCG